MVVNATIYLNQVVAGNIFSGVFGMWNAVLGGWFLFILWAVFRFLIMIKKSTVVGWISTILFLGIYASMYNNTAYFSNTALPIIGVTLVIEIGATLYSMIK